MTPQESEQLLLLKRNLLNLDEHIEVQCNLWQAEILEMLKLIKTI